MRRTSQPSGLHPFRNLQRIDKNKYSRQAHPSAQEKISAVLLIVFLILLALILLLILLTLLVPVLVLLAHLAHLVSFAMLFCTANAKNILAGLAE